MTFCPAEEQTVAPNSVGSTLACDSCGIAALRLVFSNVVALFWPSLGPSLLPPSCPPPPPGSSIPEGPGQQNDESFRCPRSSPQAPRLELTDKMSFAKLMSYGRVAVCTWGRHE